MIVIEKLSPDPQRPYANLLPILDALVAAGNELLDGGFLLNKDGWSCRLAHPIDFGLVEANFRLPPNISLAAEVGSIHDRLSWAQIEGPRS